MKSVTMKVIAIIALTTGFMKKVWSHNFFFFGLTKSKILSADVWQKLQVFPQHCDLDFDLCSKNSFFGLCCRRGHSQCFTNTPWFFSDYIMSSLRREKFETPTPIQSVTWPMCLSGRDVVGIAQTGSGKTLGVKQSLMVLSKEGRMILKCITI